MRDGVRFWGVQYHPEYTLPFIGQHVCDLAVFEADVAVDLQIAHTAYKAAK